MFKAVIGDLFASEAQTLVNTVNCVGVMGKGVALEFKKRFPRMVREALDRWGASRAVWQRPRSHWLSSSGWRPSGR